jgi:chitin disaccharide deacetylase
VPSHINGHHNVHTHAKVREIVADYAKTHAIFIRRERQFTDGKSVETKGDSNNFFTSQGVKMTDHIFEYIQSTYEESFQGFIKDLETVEDGTSSELFVHVAYVDDTLLTYSSLNWERQKRDLVLLKDPKFKQAILDLGCEITDFTTLSA